uniref:Uncharacterized protein n=1 Tax=Anguilla anguilla TaxID=7936 RepID=A0A0E9XPX2_ANGAN
MQISLTLIATKQIQHYVIISKLLRTKYLFPSVLVRCSMLVEHNWIVIVIALGLPLN